MSHQVVYVRPMKSVGVAYLWLIFFGWLGAHHFYIGKIGRGVGYLLTFGWLGIGLIIDLFTLASQVRMANLLRQSGHNQF